MVWAYQRATGREPESSYSWLLPLAQSAFETGNWQSMYNWDAGFISQPNKSLPYYYRGTNVVPFASYSTLRQGCLAMMRWLSKHGTLAYADNNDLAGYVASLQAGGYVGSNPSVYPAYQAGIAGELRSLAGVVPEAYSEGSSTMLGGWRVAGAAAGILAVSAVAAVVIHPDLLRRI